MSNHNSCGLCSIEMKNISVTSGEDILLDNINLTFHCGELTALIGKNGAGKTTLLRTLLGERHYKGSISFTDHHGVVLPMPRIGYVPQHLDFDKSMPISVSDFIAAAKGGSPVWLGKQKKMQAHIREILEDMECGYLAERRLGAAASCSGCFWHWQPIRFPIYWFWTSLFRVWIWQGLTCFTKE